MRLSLLGQPDTAIRILIMEDNAADAKLMVYSLKAAGFKIESEVACDGESFKRLLASRSYDVILADYHVPGYTGLDAIKWVRESEYDVPIILVTGTLTDERAAECFRQGANDYVLKNKMERLPVALTQLLQARRLREARDRAIEHLRESEQQYRLLFNVHPQPLCVFDAVSLRFVEVNLAAIERYGYSREEFLRMTIRDIRPGEDIPALVGTIDEQNSTDACYVGTWRHRKKDGSIFEVEITSHPIIFSDRPARLVLLNDVSQVVRGERALRHSEERFQKIFEANPESVTITGLSDGRYLFVNDSFSRLTGYTPAEAIGQYTIDTFWGDPQARNAYVQKLMADGRVRNLELNFRTKAGEARIGLLSSELIELEGERCILSVTKDITEQKQLERQFLQAQRMEAVGRLAGGVAHDFNNLLMIIGSSAQLIQEMPRSEQIVEKYTRQIANAVSKASALTRQLLAFSRNQVLIPTVVDLNEVLADLHKMLPRLVGEDIDIVLSLGPDMGAINADQAQVEQIVMNLVVNARDAMPHGGRLTIETSNIEIDEENLGSHGVKGKPGRYVMLAISDTGIGMDEETKARVFEPFFTTKEFGKGTGLGLATVYGIVKQSEGWIWVYSEPGKGSCFKVYLPRSQNQSPRSTVEAKREAPTGTETILLVEDEAELLSITAEYLQKKGYRVIQAENGRRALQIINKFKGKIDLLITDMVMPEVGGVRLVEESTAKRPDMRVIFVSGYAERTVNDDITKNSAEFMQKPFSLSLLTQKVRMVLDRRSGA